MSTFVSKFVRNTVGLIVATAFVLSSCATQSPVSQAGGTTSPSNESPLGAKWCSGMTIRYFVGGDEGDSFGTILLRGAQAAAADLGPTVQYVFSGWDSEKMVQQLREAIAEKPDGIAAMGYGGDDAILPLAQQAKQNNVLLVFHNVDVPIVRSKAGGGYVGADNASQGAALAQEAVNTLGLKSGDHVIVFGAFDQPGRFIREEAEAKAFEAAGVIVTRITDPAASGTDQNVLTPIVTAALLADPAVKLVSFDGGQVLGATEMYWKAAGKKPGEVLSIGYDTSPAVMDGFKKGYIQLSADQEPLLQGYLPILSLCLMKKYGFAPLSVDTGAGFVTQANYQTITELANQGLR